MVEIFGLGGGIVKDEVWSIFHLLAFKEPRFTLKAANSECDTG